MYSNKFIHLIKVNKISIRAKVEKLQFLAFFKTGFLLGLVSFFHAGILLSKRKQENCKIRVSQAGRVNSGQIQEETGENKEQRSKKRRSCKIAKLRSG